MNAPQDQPRRPLAWLVAACATGLLLALSWRQWCSPFVDFGRELYAAWRLAEGDALHTDLAWFNGPLAPWWNGLVFTVLGDGLLQLVTANLLLLALLLALLLGLAEAMFDRWTALATALVVPTLFGISQTLGIGNYNFLTPYSHDLTLGVLLGVLAAGATWRAGRGLGARGLAWDALAGAAVGAAFLTKPETFVAAAGAWLVGTGLGATRRPARLLLGAGSALFVVAAAYLKLRAELPPGGPPGSQLDPRRALLGAWPYVLDGRVRELPFYGQITGLGHPQVYGTALFHACLRAAGLALACAALVCAWTRRPAPHWAPLALAGLLLHAAWFHWVPWFSVARPLPLVAGGLALASVWSAARTTGDARARAALRASFAVLATGLLSKTPLNTRWAHYGFALALPATLLATGLTVHALPKLLARRGTDLAAGARVLALCFWIVASGAGCERSLRNWRAQSSTFGRGADTLHALPQLATPLQEALDWLAPRIGPDQTLLVLPEGVMLNYQLRRKSPTRHINFMPPELLFWGEDQLLEELRAARPDYVVLVHKDVREYGFRAFGEDYGRDLYAWARAEHTLEKTFGAVPFTSPAFGVAVYSR